MDPPRRTGRAILPASENEKEANEERIEKANRKIQKSQRLIKYQEDRLQEAETSRKRERTTRKKLANNFRRFRQRHAHLLNSPRDFASWSNGYFTILSTELWIDICERIVLRDDMKAAAKDWASLTRVNKSFRTVVYDEVLLNKLVDICVKNNPILSKNYAFWQRRLRTHAGPACWLKKILQQGGDKLWIQTVRQSWYRTYYFTESGPPHINTLKERVLPSSIDYFMRLYDKDGLYNEDMSVDNVLGMRLYGNIIRIYYNESASDQVLAPRKSRMIVLDGELIDAFNTGIMLMLPNNEDYTSHVRYIKMLLRGDIQFPDMEAKKLALMRELNTPTFAEAVHAAVKLLERQ